jgi:hypothetical protein
MRPVSSRNQNALILLVFVASTLILTTSSCVPLSNFMFKTPPAPQNGILVNITPTTAVPPMTATSQAKPGVTATVATPGATATPMKPGATATLAKPRATAIVATPVAMSTEPTFTCGIYSFASYLPALQIIQDRLDIQNGFRLVLHPWELMDPPILSGEMVEKIRSGEWDCLFDTLDGPAKDGNYGVITAVVDESAGADQVWVRQGIGKVNDIAGKRIAFVQETTSEFFTYALLDLVGLDKSKVTLIPVDTLEKAVASFKDGKADVVVGWEPGISDMKSLGGHRLVDSSELRYIVDTITISKQAIANKSDVIQAFHRAWFQALKSQFDDFPHSAQSIASWGENDWSAVSKETASSDLKALLEPIAQAGYGPNQIIMANPGILYERLRHAQSVWKLADSPSPNLDIAAAVNPQFVLALRDDETVKPRGAPANSSFILSGKPPPPAVSNAVTRTVVAELPVRHFDFLPERTELTADSRRLLDEQVLPKLRATTLSLRITGSAAWPGPQGRWSQADIEKTAKERASAIAQYLSNQGGIDARHLIVDYTIPPPERRNSIKESELVNDRFVELDLVGDQR